MKMIILGFFMSINLYANINIQQNIRALYRDVNLTKIEKNYILNNQEHNIDIFKKILKNETRKFKNMNNKNIISFTLTPNNKIENIKFLVKSENKKINQATINAINKSSKLFIKPTKKIEIRYIIHYNEGIKPEYIQDNTKINKPTYETIERGTTKFEYQNNEYIRVFTTSEDGYITLSQDPMGCAKQITILKNNGEKFAKASGMLFSEINRPAPKGKYKILIQVKKICNVNLNYQ